MRTQASKITLLLKQKKTEVLLFLGAFTIRFIWCLLAPVVDPFLKQSPLLGDAASYDRIARSIMQGTGFATHPPLLTAFWPPLYPYLLSGIYTIFGYDLFAARMVQVFLGAVVPLLFYLVAIRYLDRTFALMVGVGVAVYPYIVYFGAWLIAEAFFMSLFAFAFWLSARLSDQWSWKRLLVLGVTLGFCALAKPTVLFFLPFWVLWIFFAPLGKTIWSRFLITASFGLSILIIILPWTLRNYFVFHDFVLISTNGGYTFLGANNPNAWGGHNEGYPHAIPGLTEAQAEDAYYAEATQWIRSHPGDFLRLLVPKYRRLFSPLSVASYPEDYRIPGSPIIYLVYSLYLVVAAIGMFLCRNRWREVGFLYVPVLGVLLSTGMFYGDARYTIPMAPSLVFFTAYSFELAWTWARGRKIWIKRLA